MPITATPGWFAGGRAATGGGRTPNPPVAKVGQVDAQSSRRSVPAAASQLEFGGRQVTGRRPARRQSRRMDGGAGDSLFD